MCCDRFHGKPPSKNKMEKALRKDAEAIAAKRSATSEKDTHSLAQQKAESKRSATPYMVLTGKVKPGQTADPKSSYATADPQVCRLHCCSLCCCHASKLLTIAWCSTNILVVTVV